MSNVKKAKEHCGYQEKPVLPVCMNCAAFTSEKVLPVWMVEAVKNWDGTEYTAEKNGVEKNMRCSDHGFAVKKMAGCNLWRKE